MAILSMWREARGAVLRKEYEDTMARMQDANRHAMFAFHNNIDQTIDEVVKSYSAASKSERKARLKESRKAARELWASGDWPSALGYGISLMNAESRFLPGDDAAYVKAETDRLVKEARSALSGAPRG